MNGVLTKEDSFLKIENPYRLYNFASGERFYIEELVKKVNEIFASPGENRSIIISGNPGSGKSGTLKEIARTPGILGKRYVPIYLDSRNYRQLELDDLSFSLYKDITEELIEKGYQISQTDLFGERRKKDFSTTMQTILFTVDTNLKKNEILVLILDEFDFLIENMKLETISSFIKFVSRINRSWDNYRIIFAGDKGLPGITGDEIIDGFLLNGIHIDLNNILSKENIKRLITEPVEDRLIYDDEATERITGYSGENLYFQQLICYYIVEHMNKKRRTYCTSADVETVVEVILIESIPEFSFYWEQKMSAQMRVLASALADERVTEKRGDLYVLKEGTLLDDIFGKKLNKALEEFQKSGYISEMKKRRFARFPFKIALYGRWIQKEHPFIKTVIQDIFTIAGKVDLESLIKVVDEAPAEELSPFDKEAILDMAKKWRLLLNSIAKDRTIADERQVERFFESFCHRLNFNIKREVLPGGNRFIIEIKNLKIATVEEAFCFIQDRPELSEDDISYIEKQAVEQAWESLNKLSLFFYFRKTDRVEELVKKPYLNLITIDENDLKKVILSERPDRTIREIIIGKLSLRRISPYQIAGMPEATFYGRRDTIDKISSNPGTSYAVVGARKIGKTSLLHKIKEDPPPGVTYIFLNLEALYPGEESYKAFFLGLQMEIEKKLNKKVDFTGLLENDDFFQLPAVICELSKHGQKIVFIFDEIDGLILFDKENDFRLLRRLRAMSQDNLCQFIFAGFKELYQLVRDIDSPLNNFCEEIMLEPLDRGAAINLITKPMEGIGVHYENDSDTELILGYTARHPNLLQFFCKYLIENVEKHPGIENRRTIFRSDIDELYNTKYQEYVMEQVYMFKTLSNLAQLILILLVEDYSPRKSFSASDIYKKLENEDMVISMREFENQLKDLELRFILLKHKKRKNNYKFMLEVFPEILRKGIDEFYKSKIMLEIRTNEGVTSNG